MTQIVQAELLKIPEEYYLNRPDKRVAINKGGSEVRKINDLPSFFSTIKLEQTDRGCLGYVDGAEYPRKGVPTEDSVFAINIVKELVKQSLKNPLIFLQGGKALKSFNALCVRVIGNHRVHPESFCPTAKQVYLIISTFLEAIGIEKELARETAYHLAHIFELDDAYRYRIQDMAHEVDIFLIQKNPRKELKRLMDMWRERDRLGVIWKMEYYMKPVMWLLLVPKYKRAFLKTTSYIKGMDYDKADWYWMSLKDDYQFGGIPFEERVSKVKVPRMYVIGENLVVPTLDKVINASIKRL